MATVSKETGQRASVEVRRRAELVAAAIDEIGGSGSLKVTVGQIAKRAGLSSALAFHYFGDKEALFLAAMRSLLIQFGDEVRLSLASAGTPRARLDAIVDASFSPKNFKPHAIAAWLNFYVYAQTSPAAYRLLRIYRDRLTSTLAYDLRHLVGERARPGAERIAGLIDGLYLHAALDRQRDPTRAIAHVKTALEHETRGA